MSHQQGVGVVAGSKIRFTKNGSRFFSATSNDPRANVKVFPPNKRRGQFWKVTYPGVSRRLVAFIGGGRARQRAFNYAATRVVCL